MIILGINYKKASENSYEREVVESLDVSILKDIEISEASSTLDVEAEIEEAEVLIENEPSSSSKSSAKKAKAWSKVCEFCNIRNL